MNKLLILLSLLFLLTGCATAYQKEGFGGGYNDMKMGEDLYRVSFKGNGYTGSDTVHKFFLRRCAELTLEQGFDYFSTVDQNSNSSSYIISGNTTGTIQKNYYGGYNYTANTQNIIVNKHSRDGMIGLFYVGSQPDNAIDAKIFLGNFK
tara:strand:+ start:9083 stop:9529 length:447 start_codon:yes stop_codon:yes gene_type:complete